MRCDQCEASRRGAAGRLAMLAIDVIDTGSDMSEEQQDVIFEEFVQADTSISLRFGGTSLLLSISRRIAGMRGGDITVRSEAGEGSAFTATLSTGPCNNVRLLTGQEILVTGGEAQADSGTSWVFPTARVLVVDDADENRELLTVVLEGSGLAVAVVGNGRKCQGSLFSTPDVSGIRKNPIGSFTRYSCARLCTVMH